MTDDTPHKIDPQDPLPETNWFWRRVYTFALSLISVAFIWYGLESLNAMQQPQHVFSITRYMVGVHVLLITFYMLAPSAEQIVKLVQAAKLLRAGVPLRQPPALPAPVAEEVDAAPTSRSQHV